MLSLIQQKVLELNSNREMSQNLRFNPKIMMKFKWELEKNLTTNWKLEIECLLQKLLIFIE